MTEYFLVARIFSAAGKNGFVKIELITDFPDRFYKQKKVFVDFYNDKKELKIQSVKKSKNSFQLKFEDFNSDEDVSLLIGKDLFVAENDVLTLPDNQAFIHDIIGSAVLKNDVMIGTVTDLIILKSNNVYVINQNDGEELLIPAIDDYIEKFDKKNRILVLRQIEDIYDDDES